MDAGDKARMILRGVAVYSIISLTLALIIWDIISIAVPPPSVEWALLFVASNAAFLAGGWYAFYFWPRGLRAKAIPQRNPAKDR
jgi:hypothetical protein